jgi:hypothetical protein
MEAWALTYSKIPPEATEKVSSFIKPLATSLYSPAYGKYLDKRIITDSQMQAMSMRAIARLYEWAFLCFAVGAEDVRKQIDDHIVPPLPGRHHEADPPRSRGSIRRPRREEVHEAQ